MRSLGIKSFTAYIPQNEYELAEQRALDLGFGAFSKYIVHLIREDIGKKTNPSSEHLTPEQELDQVVSEMAHIGQNMGVKLAIIRRMVTRDLKLKSEKESDVDRVTDILWSHIVALDGMIQFKEKLIGIDRSDVEQYNRLGHLHFRKLTLVEQIKVPAVIPASV